MVFVKVGEIRKVPALRDGSSITCADLPLIIRRVVARTYLIRNVEELEAAVVCA